MLTCHQSQQSGFTGGHWSRQLFSQGHCNLPGLPLRRESRVKQPRRATLQPTAQSRPANPALQKGQAAEVGGLGPLAVGGGGIFFFWQQGVLNARPVLPAPATLGNQKAQKFLLSQPCYHSVQAHVLHV